MQHFAQFPCLAGSCIGWPDVQGAMVLVKALQFLPPGLIGPSELHHNALRVLVVAAFFLALDAFICVGPPKALIHRIFLADADAHRNTKKARRLVSQLAARVVGCLFLALMFPEAFATLRDKTLQADKIYAHSPTSEACIALAAGYFVYDVFICTLRFEENGPAYLVHALCCCTVFLYGALTNLLHYYGGVFLMWELSTPFVYVRWVLLKAGLADSKLVAINNLLGFAVFVGCRNIYGPIATWEFFKTTGVELAHPREGGFAPETLYVFRTICVTLNGLNYFWMTQMLRLALGGSHPKQDKHTKQS